MIVAIRDFFAGLGNTLLTLVRIPYFTRPVKSLKKLAVNNECVILGNGPSLSQSLSCDKSILEGRDVYCVNNFPVSELYGELRPGYCVMSAPEYWLRDVSDVYVKMRTETFQALKEKTQWPLILLIPVRARPYKGWDAVIRTNTNITIRYYNTCPVEGLRPVNHLFFNAGMGMPRPHNVLVPSLMIAIWNRYRNVFVLGADHTWLDKITVNENNEALVNQQHFYDGGNSQPGPMYMLGKRPRKLYEILHKFMLTFRAYWDINDYALKKNVCIINLTPGSLIDAFERKAK